MIERKPSELQREYRAFFREKLRLYNVASPVQLTREAKRQFFTEVKQDWAILKSVRHQAKVVVYKDNQSTSEDFIEVYTEPTRISSQKSAKTDQSEEVPALPRELVKQIIKSEANNEQTDNTKISFTPNNHFEQDENYTYPVVKMPTQNSPLKLPRKGRSNQKGYKEPDFYARIQHQFTDISITDDVHMVIPNYNKPYEPDIVLFDKSLNLYIDIEIDEPYDGYYRYPTHFINLDDIVKRDNIRDLFFTESGWIVIRFTEKQVHCQPEMCIELIRNVLNSIYNREFDTHAKCDIEHQWDYNQCIQWQKNYYRERYLGIDRFKKQSSYKEVNVDSNATETIEQIIRRTINPNSQSWAVNGGFDEESHKYIDPRDQTGNADYISVTTLIERFFPFDLRRYIERKAKEDNKTEEQVLDEYLTTRDEAAEKGTFLHIQIEYFLKEAVFDASSKEFELFQKFLEEKVKSKRLIFSEAEKKIFSHKFNIAGTIDCLLRKEDKDEFVILDWKRSKKLIVDGYPKKYGFGYALSELSHLDNSSYYRYCLQQNIYKYIVETEYSIKISSMKLVVLHDDYSDYYVVNVPELRREVQIILHSLKHKI